jgi:hypothetical protein
MMNTEQGLGPALFLFTRRRKRSRSGGQSNKAAVAGLMSEQQEMQMRTFLAAVLGALAAVLLAVFALVLASSASGTASAAEPYRYCAYYAGKVSGTNCGFSTFEQCMAAISGNGGFCDVNPFYYGGRAPGPGPVVVRHYRHHHAYRHHHRH